VHVQIRGAGPASTVQDEAVSTPLRDYAAIGDGRTIALVARSGSIDWFPVPDLDSLPIFAALLDEEGGGRVELAPVGPAEVERAYLPGTNVLATTFRTRTGTVRVTDSLNSGVAGRLPWAELARRVEGLDGAVEMRWRVRPGTGLGTCSAWVQSTVHGPVIRIDNVMMAVRGSGHGEPDVGAKEISGRFRTSAGSAHLLALVGTHDEPLNLPQPEEIDARLDLSAEGWRSWSEQVRFSGPRRDAVLRSGLALKLLLHSPSGAIAAAGTTSLPETLDGGKNWDYRYAWVRDTAYVLTAMINLGLREEVHAATAWLLHTIERHGPQLLPFFTLSGDVPDDEPRHADVPGWEGVSPVVVGNRAAGQLQLGVYGDLFSTLRQYVEAGHVLDVGTERLVAGLADQCCDRWQQPDSGIWELPERRHYTSSKMGCWQALDCAVALADLAQLPGDADRWRTERDAVRDWVQTHCWSETLGSYVWYPGSDGLDASVLQAASYGFDTGPRMSATIDAVRRDLGAPADPALIHRYSGMQKAEGAFVACSFWTVTALTSVGRADEAAALFADLVGRANDVGLFTEMIDPDTGAFLGNFPQGLTHLALIEAAVALRDQA
jgi:GH15 family glucan-1,4-alpha-glucosidase